MHCPLFLCINIKYTYQVFTYTLYGSIIKLIQEFFHIST
nr:MAG TPA: hypothetical protein [Caudoviricetes sp.]